PEETTEIYTLSLHTLFRSVGALEARASSSGVPGGARERGVPGEAVVEVQAVPGEQVPLLGGSAMKRALLLLLMAPVANAIEPERSEEHTSELQSRENLV